MKTLSIRHRILLAVLAPAALVALLITGMLVAQQMQKAQADQHRRLAAVARQIAAAAEYGIFTGNNDALQRLLQTALSEPDVIAAAFLDAQGQMLVGTLPPAQLPDPQQVFASFDPAAPSAETEHWHGIPIQAVNVGEADLYSLSAEDDRQPLGRLLLKVTTQSLHDEIRGDAIKAAAIAVLMLLLGTLLALGLSRGLIRTLTDIGHVVEGIGAGRMDLRIHSGGKDELDQLAQGINLMADAVGQTQEQLAARIDAATAALRQERDDAAQASQARSRFFAAASHDLRQPAHALGLFVARLERDAAQTRLHPQLRKLAQSVTNLQDLLATLLDYSRLDGQVVRVETRPVQAAQAIEQAVESLAEAAAAKKLALRSRIVDCWLQTDPALLHRILLNLIGNAVRHTAHGGILVTCRRGTHHARIEVWDTGPGIPREFQEAVFEELVQLDNPERDAEKGLGLGLAIVRRSADLLSHPLSLCSRVGQGSRFAIQVPLAAPPATDDNAAAGAVGKRVAILLVGPSTPAQDELAAQFEDWHYAVARIGGLDTDTLTGHANPAAVILELPEGAAGIANGQAWLARIEAEVRHPLPALFISHGPTPAPAEGSGGAPRLLLSRPFRPARLRALLTGLLAAAEQETG